jgi:hypothetical protein
MSHRPHVGRQDKSEYGWRVICLFRSIGYGMVSEITTLAIFRKTQRNQCHLCHPLARLAQVGLREAGRQGKSNTIRRAQVAGGASAPAQVPHVRCAAAGAGGDGAARRQVEAATISATPPSPEAPWQRVPSTSSAAGRLP